MNTLKSAAVIAVLLGVLYGVYVALNKPQVGPPLGVSTESLDAPQIEYGAPGDAAPDMADAEASSLPPPFPSSSGSQGSYDGPPAASPPLASEPSSESYNAHASATSPADATGGLPPTAAPPLEPTTQPAEPPTDNSTANAAPADAASEQPSNPALTAWSLKQDWQAAEQEVANGKFRDALSRLSRYYGHADLTPDDHAQLIAWLDALAGKVIYSREHLLAERHQVRGRETLFDIAAQHQVSAELLHSINRHTVNDPSVLVPGTELKIVPGPFRAHVDLAKGEVTLILGELYAGRFPFTLGSETPQPGSYQVADKATSHNYVGADGRVIAANDPLNPYGGAWIDLGREVSIHGSPAIASGTNEALGCISLSPQDARDLYGILTIGSEVTIR